MKYLFLMFLGIVLTSSAFAQVDAQVDTTINLDVVQKMKNPIVFGEIFTGASYGFLYGAEINYQVKNALFMARFTGITDFNVYFATPILPIPTIDLKGQFYEPAVLYGYRYIKGRHSFSASAGISYNRKLVYLSKTSTDYKRYEYMGIPFELNYKLFEGEKERIKIFGIFPVGKPVAFSGSLGVKIIGNISKFSYFGAGVSLGLGYHKVYED